MIAASLRLFPSFFFFFTTAVALLYELPPGVAPEFPLMFFRLSLLPPLPLNVPASSHLPLRQREHLLTSAVDPFLFRSFHQCGLCLHSEHNEKLKVIIF